MNLEEAELRVHQICAEYEELKAAISKIELDLSEKTSMVEDVASELENLRAELEACYDSYDDDDDDDGKL